MTKVPIPRVATDLPVGWTERYRFTREPSDARLVATAQLPLSRRSRAFLATRHPDGIYSHQADAVRAALARNDTCLATGTASGKTLAFTLAAIETLERDPDAAVLAVYPLKALSNAQAALWERALEDAGLPSKVARLDGSVGTNQRGALVQNASVICMTPDLAHAWLLGRLDLPEVRRLVSRLRLVIVDEVHTYSGVLGTNAAYLFRRLEHACALLGHRIQYFTASATLAQGDNRLERLFGRPFTIIDSTRDGSPRQPLTVQLVQPPSASDTPSSAAALLEDLRQGGQRALLFSDGRKLVELITTILGRGASESERQNLEEQWFLPYRAGYEDSDRRLIEQRLSDPSLHAIISTSALELGLDIQGLDTVVLLGVPTSAVSVQQRIGRVGRQRPGRVIVVNTGSAADETRFSDPETALDRPFPDAALYLDNRRIQFIHAMCLARPGGEHDLAASRPRSADASDFESPVAFPEGFLEMCRLERTGQTPADLIEMSVLATGRPQHEFPLRSTEAQFRVVRVGFGGEEPIGQLTHGQVLREAYPGALYWHLGRGYRVLRVKHTSREVNVKPERGQSTSPVTLPSVLYPNFADGRAQRLELEALLLVETPMQVQQSVAGVTIAANPKRTVMYPLDGRELGGVRFSESYFSRRIFTTGVLLFHPALQGLRSLEDVAATLLEAFLMLCPGDRADVSAGAGKLKLPLVGVGADAPFISIFDQANGSLRISSRMMERGILTDLLQLSAKLALDGGDDRPPLGESAVDALERMAAEAQRARMSNDGVRAPDTSGGVTGLTWAPAAGSEVWTAASGGQRFRVARVFFSPKASELMATGEYLDSAVPGQIHHVPLRSIIPIPGESVMAPFDADTGDYSGPSRIHGEA